MESDLTGHMPKSIHSLCAVVLTHRPGKDSASAEAELVWRIASGCLLASPPELGTVGPNTMQDDGNLASDRDARLPAADPPR